MSVTKIHKCNSIKALVTYCTTQKKEQTKERVAAEFCNLENRNVFMNYSDEIIKSHNRKVEGYAIIQSFEQDEFDVESEEDAQRVNDMGRDLAYALYPNSAFVVITHADSAGKCMHNHIIVLNHDLITDKCITKNRFAKCVRAENDKIMRRNNLRICKQSEKQVTEKEYWSNKKRGWLDMMQDSVDRAVSEATSIREFEDFLRAEGITPALRKKDGTLKQTFTYTITDEAGTQHKKRSDRLGADYTRNAIETKISQNLQKRKEKNVMSMSEYIAQKTLQATTKVVEHKSLTDAVQKVPQAKQQTQKAQTQTAKATEQIMLQQREQKHADVEKEQKQDSQKRQQMILYLHTLQDDLQKAHDRNDELEKILDDDAGTDEEMIQYERDYNKNCVYMREIVIKIASLQKRMRDAGKTARLDESLCRQRQKQDDYGMSL